MELVQKKLVFTQDSDTMQEGYDYQELEVEIVDSGGGSYAILSTKRWALDIDDLEKLVAMLKQEIESVGFGIQYKINKE